MVEEDPRRRVLVIGGTSFIGRATVAALLADGHAVTVCNRGRTPSPFGTAVRHIRCDRRERPAELRAALEEGWDACVDFVAFDPADVAPVVDVGARCLGRYVLISTDSVYMACEPAGFRRARSGGLLEASDGGGRSVERAAADEYGADKLAAEAALARGAAGLDWAALRLPDVLGPHENTGRLDRLLLRLAKGRRVGTAIGRATGAAETLPLGLVFADDVATAVCAALRSPLRDADDAPIRALHVCASEAPTWPELVRMAAAELDAAGIHVPELRYDATRDTGFVSVDFGALDGSAARRALDGWAPAPLETRLRECIAWWVARMRSQFDAAADAHDGAPSGT